MKFRVIFVEHTSVITFIIAIFEIAAEHLVYISIFPAGESLWDGKPLLKIRRYEKGLATRGEVLTIGAH